ncbi:BatA domain-containing protein [Pedobacter hartonius]|uniref:N-terminal double-transmembrane domain-containing protein n=1 Tax=Pedobacter hartonius TaxID=425514 RepID=A0A1H4H659_9SPHI|nr:BatA domain-containing protein [Pedobacter hartonius]SEB16900.1 N-terminal double-transmembrane domain-containing protein [Pedobacter hartonius]
MNFLYSGFLFFLLAIAIPILIHLFNFRRFKKVYFSNVQFLKAAQEQNSSRESLKNLLILFSRILALIFLVLAFARPYLSSDTAYRPETGSLVNIYIDNSYSMGSVNKEGSLLDEAKRKAKDIAKQFSPNDRFQLTTNDFEGRHQHLVGYAELAGLIDEVKISAAQRSLQQVINRQHTTDAGKRNLFSYILSDFQRNFVGIKAISTAADDQLSLVRLQANTLPNIAVDSIWSLSPVHRPGEQEKFVVKLRNYTNEAGTGIPVKLLVNNQQRALARLNVPAGQSVTDTLTFSGLSAGWQKAAVSIKDYPLTFDDELKFTFKVSSGLNVLHISGDPAERHISALFSGDGYFRMTVMPESNVVYAAFSGYQLIVLSGLKTPSSGLALQLKNFVQNGGSAVIFPDLDVNTTEFSSFLQGLSLPPVVSLSRDTLSVKTIDLKSNLFTDVFEEIPAKVDLPLVNRHFVYAANTRSSRENIMELPSGQSFFSRYRLGAGQIYLSASSLKAEDGNLSQHPVFVPLLYKIALTSIQEQPLYYTIGKNNLLTTTQLSLSPNQSLRLTSGEDEVIPELRQTPGKTLLYIADQIRASGFYELLKADSVLSSYAFNESRAESDMNFTGDKDLKQFFGKKSLTVAGAATDLSAAVMENNYTELWKLCLVLCAVFLAAEALLIRFFNKKTI